MARETRPVENYTTAFLWMAGLVLFIALMVIWAAFSFAMSVFSGFMVKLVIDRLPQRD